MATLPEYHELEKRLNTALVDDLPKAMRRRKQTLAIDLTLIPYHGEPHRRPDKIYRKRFGIETSYRQMDEARIRTCSRNSLLRLLFFGLAMIFRNVWVWFHLTTLSERRGRRLALHLECLPFRDMLLNLQRVVEALMGITQRILGVTSGYTIPSDASDVFS